MKYLIDTCVISELSKPSPNKKVVSWIGKNDEKDLYSSVLTFGELYKGIAKLPDSKRKRDLYRWVELDLKERFNKRIINVDFKVAKMWGQIQSQLEPKGHPLPAVDALIAATGIAYGLTVVTRNTTDMEESGGSFI
jgi:predicted nucleic acid-binding protein